MHIQTNMLSIQNIMPDTSQLTVQNGEDFSTSVLEDFINKASNDLAQFVNHIIIAIVVFYVGKFLIKRIYRLVDVIMTKREVEQSLSTFVLSLVRIVLYFLLIITVIGILGIETSSFLALFASAGVAIGMALSGTLQNFAGGVLILLLKPYKVGDYIEAQGYAGTVTEIQIFHTIICTYDNKSIIIPNGGLSTGSINNWSREDYRRVQWQVSVSYGDDIDKVRKAVLAMFAADKDVVKTTIASHKGGKGLVEEAVAEPQAEPAERKRGFFARLFHTHGKRVQREITSRTANMKTQKSLHEDLVNRAPSVVVGELADSSVNVIVRAWVPPSRYWDIFYKYNERFYAELPKTADVHFPFPQIDVHFPEKEGSEGLKC